MEPNWTQLIVTLGSIGTGAFALLKYMTKKHDEIIQASNEQVGKMQTQFLEHLQVKNGHMERISEKFDSTVREFNKTISSLTVEIKRNNDSHYKKRK